MNKSKPISYHSMDTKLPWNKRPFFWSQISSFEYSPDQWYENYYLGNRTPPSKEIIFGSYVDNKLQVDPTFLPEVVRYPLLQHEMAVMFNGIKLCGTADAFHREEKKLRDYKTGKVPWTQKRADETGQLSMYLLLLYVSETIHPEDMTCYIDWLPTVEGGDFNIEFRDSPPKVVTFQTKRTMKDILEFGAKINRIYKEMEEYAKEKGR